MSKQQHPIMSHGIHPRTRRRSLLWFFMVLLLERWTIRHGPSFVLAQEEPARRVVPEPLQDVSETRTRTSITNPNTSIHNTNNSNNSGTSTNLQQQQQQQQRRYEEFLKWCHYTLGIQSLVTIQDFQYPQRPYHPYHNNNNDDHDSNSYYNITTRGLAAIRNINKGEIVISVPFHALLTLPTTIDHDPVLSQLMGPAARQRHGWNLDKTRINHHQQHQQQQQEDVLQREKDDDDDDDDDIILSYYETALLTVAILYHVQLHTLSPQWFYMDILLQTNLTSIPFYNASSHSNTITYHPSHEVQYIIKQIQKDIRDMYQNVMIPLIQQHAHIFGKPLNTKKDHDPHSHSDVQSTVRERTSLFHGDNHETEPQPQEPSPQEQEEWMYSYEKFEWAFAIVHSRHWHLPLQDLDDMMSDFQPHGSMYWNDASFDMDYNRSSDGDSSSGSSSSGSDSSSTTTDTSTDSIHQMPASLPTEEYISLQQQQLQQQQQREEEEADEEVKKMQHVEEYIQSTSSLSSSSFPKEEKMITKHSFMAPLADMMNFGPPCTRGQYNTITKAFEVVATCDFVQGQEVTFWYSDACDDVILANYGFTHPLIPKCPTIHDWKKRSDMWKEYSESLERLLEDVYQDLHDAIDDLKNCDCSNETHDVGTAVGVNTSTTSSSGSMARKRWKEVSSRLHRTIMTDASTSTTSSDVDLTSTDATTNVESTATTSTMRDKPPPSKTTEEGPRRIRRTKARDMDEEHEDIGL
jgi:hypothetical protein